MKADDIPERLLAWTRISADSSAKQPSWPRSWLLPRRPPAQLSRSELIAHCQFPVGLDFRLTPMPLGWNTGFPSRTPDQVSPSSPKFKTAACQILLILLCATCFFHAASLCCLSTTGIIFFSPTGEGNQASCTLGATTQSMNARKTLPPLAFLVGLASCGTVDPALMQRIDEAFGQSKMETRPNGARTDWQVGQWVLLRVVSDGVKLLRRITVSGKEGKAFWIEIHDIESKGESHTGLLIDGFDPESPRRLRLLKAKLEEGEATVEVSGDEVEGPRGEKIRERSSAFLARLKHLQALGKPRDITVGAGTFKESNATPISITSRVGTWTGFVWYTNAVPLIYYAKVEMTRMPLFKIVTGQLLEEVVDFGLSAHATRGEQNAR